MRVITDRAGEKEQKIRELQESISCQRRDPENCFHSISKIERLIREARELGVDVSVYEAEFPELERNYLIADLSGGIKHRIQCPDTMLWTDNKIREGIEKLKRLGVDVAEFEWRFARVDLDGLEYGIRQRLGYIETYPDYFRSRSISEVSGMIKKLEESGADITAYQTRLNMIKKRLVEKEIQRLKEMN